MLKWHISENNNNFYFKSLKNPREYISSLTKQNSKYILSSYLFMLNSNSQGIYYLFNEKQKKISQTCA